MVGIAKESIVMNLDEAKEYVRARLCCLYALRDETEEKLESINNEIDEELDKLDMLENPPSPRCLCSDCENGR